MGKDLRKASINGLVFRFMERILAQLVSTLVTIVLARILLPEDYGVVSLLTIFITLCNVLVSDGLSSALIQKEKPDTNDYSTIFWASIFFSIVLYLICFLAAPFIADFYDNTLITNVLRVMALRIPLAAFNSVQGAYVSKKFLFKKFFYATLIGTIASGFVGIFLAYRGFGPWALVAQYLTNSFMDTFCMLLMIDWHPTFYFSWKSFCEMFSFGWKVCVSELINEGYEELRSLVIGKEYSTADLSFYTRGKNFPQLIGNNITTTITNVMFPVFSEVQRDVDKLKNMVRRSINVGCFLLCPMMIGFGAISESFVRLVLTDKWLPCVPFMQIFSIMFIFKPIKNINKSSLKALKRSDLDLNINVAEKVIGVIFIFLLLRCGTLLIAVSALITYIIGSILYAIFNGRSIKYSFKEQIEDILPSLFLAVISCTPAYFMNRIEMNLFVMLVLQVIVSASIYILLAKMVKMKSYVYLVQLIAEKRARRREMK